MSDPKTIVEALNAAVRLEHTLSMQCFQQSLTVRGLWRLTLAPMFEEMSDEARGHARKFGQKVVALGAVPTTEVAEVAVADTPEQMLVDTLELERRAMQAYQQALQLAADDVALRTMLEDHIEEETRHIEALELLIGDRVRPTASVRRVS